MSKLMQTDQRICFDENGVQIPCPGSGQDGELQCGRSWPMPRFMHERDVVVDRLSGLTWTRDGNLFDFPLAWSEAIERIEEMNREKACGYDDWRLPRRSELFGLLSHININPALPQAHVFKNVFPGYYWTKTVCARLPEQAWYVHLGGGRVQRGMQKGFYMVWPVRGASSAFQFKAGRRFIKQGNVTTDKRTGLVWTTSADGLNGPVKWKDALRGVQKLNRSNIAGWRLPNIRELASLADMKRHSPALPDSHPFSDLRPAYWSSTTSAYNSTYAWVAEFKDGALGVGYKGQPVFHCWYVNSNT